MIDLSSGKIILKYFKLGKSLSKMFSEVLSNLSKLQGNTGPQYLAMAHTVIVCGDSLWRK